MSVIVYKEKGICGKKQEIKEFATYNDAERFCEKNNYEIVDDDGTEWRLDFKEKSKHHNVYVGMPVWIYECFSYRKTLYQAKVSSIYKDYFYCTPIEKQSVKIKVNFCDKYDFHYGAKNTKTNDFCEVYFSYDDYLKEKDYEKSISCIESIGIIRIYDFVSQTINFLYKNGLTAEYIAPEGFVDKTHKMLTLYANKTADGHRGNIYESRIKAVTAHPDDEIILGFRIIDSTTGLVPKGCEDWNDSAEKAIADFEKAKNGGKTND